MNQGTEGVTSFLWPMTEFKRVLSQSDGNGRKNSMRQTLDTRAVRQMLAQEPQLDKNIINVRVEMAG